MDLTKLTQELITRRALGFSADPEGPDGYVKDIIRNLEKSEYITYDPETAVVKLLPANVIKKFLFQTYTRMPTVLDGYDEI